MKETKEDCDGRLERKKFLSLIAPVIPLKDLKERYGLKISGKQYTKARDHAKLHGAGTSTKIIPMSMVCLVRSVLQKNGQNYSVKISKHVNARVTIMEETKRKSRWSKEFKISRLC